MDSLKLIHALTLSNGLTISIYDLTKVYFGDYHHVRLRIICRLDTAVNWNHYFPEQIDFRSLQYTRTLDKMGVPSADIKSVIETLLNDFDRNALPYISSADFPRRMINNQLSCKEPPVRKYLGANS